MEQRRRGRPSKPENQVDPPVSTVRVRKSTHRRLIALRQKLEKQHQHPYTLSDVIDYALAVMRDLTT